jgi:hypothetical protein
VRSFPTGRAKYHLWVIRKSHNDAPASTIAGFGGHGVRSADLSGSNATAKHPPKGEFGVHHHLGSADDMRGCSARCLVSGSTDGHRQFMHRSR